MGDMGDVFREHKEYMKTKKQENLNEANARFMELRDLIEVKLHTEFHWSIMIPSVGHVDYYPSTSKWVTLDVKNKKKIINGSFSDFVNWTRNRLKEN